MRRELKKPVKEEDKKIKIISSDEKPLIEVKCKCGNKLTIDATIKKEYDALDGKFNGSRAVLGDREYTVKSTYMDSNGCLKTYDGYKESFIIDTEYYN